MIVCGHVLCSFIMIVCGDVLCSFHNVRRNVGGECGATSSPASANAPSARGRQAPAAFSASLSRSSRQYPGNDHPTEIRQMTFGFGGSLRRLSFSGKLGSFRRDNLQARSFMSAHDAVDGSLSSRELYPIDTEQFGCDRIHASCISANSPARAAISAIRSRSISTFRRPAAPKAKRKSVRRSAGGCVGPRNCIAG